MINMNQILGLEDTLKTVASDVRVSALENETKLMIQKFTDNFDDARYIDIPKTSAIINTNKISLAKQTVITELFANNSKMDIDNSYGVKVGASGLQLIPGTTDGIFVSSEFPTQGTDKVQLDTVETIESDGGFIFDKLVDSVPYKMKSIVDRVGRLWTFFMDYQKPYPRMYYRVFNSDGSVLMPFQDAGFVSGIAVDCMTNAPSNFDLEVDFDNHVYVLYSFANSSTRYVRLCRFDSPALFTVVDQTQQSASYPYLHAMSIGADNKITMSYMRANNGVAIAGYSAQYDCTNGVMNRVWTVFSNVTLASVNSHQLFYDPISTKTYLLYNYGTSIRIFTLIAGAYAPVTIIYTLTLANIFGSVFCKDDRSINTVSIVSGTYADTLRFTKFSIAGGVPIIDKYFSVGSVVQTVNNGDVKVCLDSNGITLHVIYLSFTDSATYSNVRYVAFDIRTGEMIKGDTPVYPHSTTATTVLSGMDIYEFNGKIYITMTSNASTVQMIMTPIQTISEYFISNDNGSNFFPITKGGTYNFVTRGDKIKLKIHLTAPTMITTPYVASYQIQEWKTGDGADASGELISKTLPTIQNSGNGIFSASMDLKGGSVEWFLSIDGGTTYIVIQPNIQFSFSGFVSSNIKIKAVLTSPGTELYPPEIYSYTLTTSAVVLQSDMENLRIDMMKTNFKIDSYTNASRNGLPRMTIDVFSNILGIDVSKSTYTFDSVGKSVSGTQVVSTPDVILNSTQLVMITVDAVLGTGTITYYISRDGGLTYQIAIPDILCSIGALGDGTSLVIKAVFTGNAKLNAWAWAWN